MAARCRHRHRSPGCARRSPSAIVRSSSASLSAMRPDLDEARVVRRADPELDERVLHLFDECERLVGERHPLLERVGHPQREGDEVEHPEQEGGVAAGPGRGDGVVDQLTPVLVVAGVGELVGQGGEQQGPLVVRRARRDGGLQHLDAVGVDAAEDAERADVVGEGGRRQALVVARSAGDPCRLQERVPVLRVAGLPLGRAQSDQQVEARRDVVVAELIVQQQRLTEVRDRVTGSERGQRVLARLAGPVPRPSAVRAHGGLEPVVGQLGHLGAGVAGVLEQLRDAAVQPCGLVRSEVGQDGVLDQRVGEPEPARRVGDLADERRRRRVLEDAEHLVLVQPGGGGEEGHAELAPDDGRRAEDGVAR